MTDIYNLPQWYWHRTRDWKERSHRSARLMDTKNWTMSVGSDYIHDGSHREFVIILIHRIRRSRKSMEGWKGAQPYYMEYKHRHVTIPTVKWYKAHKRGGWLMRYYVFQTRVLRRMALGPRR